MLAVSSTGAVPVRHGEYSTMLPPFFRKQVPTGSLSVSENVLHWYRGAQALNKQEKFWLKKRKELNTENKLSLTQN